MSLTHNSTRPNLECHHEEPDELLEEFIEQIPIGPALDLGMGEGRNALYLARYGFDVVGVDISTQAVRRAQQIACERGLELRAMVADVREFSIEPAHFTAIVAAAILHFLMPAEIARLARRIEAGLQHGGFVFAYVFTVDDPAYETLQQGGVTPVAPRTFLIPEFDCPMHFFAPGGLRRLFPGLETVYYAEERHLDLLSGEPQFRAGAFLVARK